MKIESGFPLQVLLTLTVVSVAGFYPLMKMDSPDVLVAVITGALLSTLNVLAGFLAIERSLGRSHEAFLKAVLGGMGVRMVVMLGLLAFLIKIVGLHTVGLVVSVLGFHAVFLVLELMYINRRVSTIQKS